MASDRPTDVITISMTRTEALALARIANVGIKVSEALGLIQSTAAAERGMNAVTEAASRPRGRA